LTSGTPRRSASASADCDFGPGQTLVARALLGWLERASRASSCHSGVAREPPEGCPRPERGDSPSRSDRCARHPGRSAHADRRDVQRASRTRHPGGSGSQKDLGGGTSPWEERALLRRQRRWGDNGLVSGAKPWSRLLPTCDRDPGITGNGGSAGAGASRVVLAGGPDPGSAISVRRRRGGSRFTVNRELRLCRHRPTGALSSVTGACGFGRRRSGTWQRHEGIGRSDAVRLLTRGTLRRVL